MVNFLISSRPQFTLQNTVLLLYEVHFTFSDFCAFTIPILTYSKSIGRGGV